MNNELSTSKKQIWSIMKQIIQNFIIIINKILDNKDNYKEDIEMHL